MIFINGVEKPKLSDLMTEDEKYGVVLISPKGKKFRMVKC